MLKSYIIKRIKCYQGLTVTLPERIIMNLDFDDTKQVLNETLVVLNKYKNYSNKSEEAIQWVERNLQLCH